MSKWLVLAVVLMLCTGLHASDVSESFKGDDAILSDFADYFASNFEEEYLKYQQTGVRSTKLRALTQELATFSGGNTTFTTTNIAEWGLADQFLACTACRATVRVVMRLFREPLGEENEPERKQNVKSLVLNTCRELNLQSEEVCAGFFDVNWEIWNFILQKSNTDSRSICSTLPIKFCKAKQYGYNISLNIDESNTNQNFEKSKAPEKSLDDLVVLQITDIHYDPLYTPGALADCGDGLCCQRKNTVGESKGAGYWSDYRNCDSPLHMIIDALEHIKRTHPKIDMIYHTGDIVDHMVWGTSQEKNKNSIIEIDQLFEKYFSNVPIYNSVGNHDSHPLNSFGPSNVPEELTNTWLYKHLNTLWRKWLPAETEETVIGGGYYTVTPKPGFRIISLNNNECYVLNWWLYYNGSIVLPQLQWLHDTLLAAEKADEYVHILSHIPSGLGNCWTIWSREFNRIVKRFRNTISAMFNGHTHFDEFYVHYTSEGSAFGVSWNGGSLTSYFNKNPNYKIFYITPKTMEVVDFETWTFNLTEANELGSAKSPKWFQEYVFSTDFHDDLSPAGMNKFLEKLSDNPKLLRKLWRFKSASAEPSISKGCDEKCLKKFICRLATTVYDQQDRCPELQRRLEIGLKNEEPDEPTSLTEPYDPNETTKPNVPDEPQPNEPTGNGGHSPAHIYLFQMRFFLGLIFMLKILL